MAAEVQKPERTKRLVVDLDFEAERTRVFRDGEEVTDAPVVVVLVGFADGRGAVYGKHTLQDLAAFLAAEPGLSMRLTLALMLARMARGGEPGRELQDELESRQAEPAGAVGPVS